MENREPTATQNQLPGLKWTRWLLTQEQASDSLTPSQQLCLPIKSLPQDSSSLYELGSVTAAAGGTGGPEPERFKNLTFTGQHAAGG